MAARSICLGILAALFAAGATEIKFDEKLTGWVKSHAPGVAFDTADKVSQTGSVRLTADQRHAYIDVRKDIGLEPNRKYEFTVMVKGENLTDKRTGLFFNAGKKWERCSRWTGTFDWTKCTGELDTGKLGGGKVTLHITLYGKEGRLWIDQLNLTEKKTAKKTNFTTTLYPIDREGGQLNICENLPVIVQLLNTAPAKFREHYRNKTSRLTVDLPKFLKLMGSRTGRQSGWHKNYNVVNPMTADKTVVRDGVEYQRYVIDYHSFLALFMCVVRPDNFNYHLLFEAVPGSAGKTGKAYWNFEIGGEKYPEQSFTVKVLPPAKMTEPPCREFQLALYRQYIPNHSNISKTGYDETLKFWKSLAKSNMYAVVRPESHVKKLYGDKVCLMINGNDCISALNWQELFKIRKIMPTDVSLKGVKHPDISAWALIEDKDGLFEKYLRNLCRMAKEHKPQIKIFVWDIEPFGFGKEGCDEGGRERFAKKMNLKTVPTIAEINEKYKEQHYQYMMKLHTQLIRKVAGILKREYPEAELWMCTGNLTVTPPHYSRWACLDLRQIEDLVNMHFNMPYYTGTRFFDDIEYNVKNLKKPNCPIHYPSYTQPAFDYTPARLVQNLVGSAAAGCVGAGLGEGDILSGSYHLALAKAFSMISRAEKYYFHGQRCDGEIKITPKNAISRKLASGQTITSPDFSQVIRYTAHKLNGKYLITLLNYHQDLPLIAEVSGKDFKPVLVKVAPEGCEQVGTGLISPQEPLRQEIAAYSAGGDAFKDHVSGSNKAVWTASKNGQALIQLSDGKIFAGVDSLQSGEVVSLQNAAGKELLTKGFIGRIMFLDRLQPKLRWKTERYGLGKDNTPYLISTAEVGPYEGALPDPNPLQGMKIRRTYTVRDGRLLAAFEFVNPAQKEMPLVLRLNNLPWPGFRFNAKNMILNGKYDLKSPAGVTIPYDGKAVTLKASDGGLTDEIVFQPKTKFKEIFSWNDFRIRKTIEFVVDCKLPPGASLKAEYEVQVK